MATERKLTDEMEQSLLVGYLSGIPLVTVTKDFSISEAMVGNSILRGRSRDWNNALVELYRATPVSEREKNGMHLYLSIIGKDVVNWEVVTKNHPIARYAFNRLESGIVVPKTSEIAQRTGIEVISELVVTPSDRLIRAVFGPRSPDSYVLPIFNKNAFEAFNERNYSWDAVSKETLNEVALRVSRGDLSMSPYKKQVLSDVLKTLTFRERHVIEGRFGLHDGKIKSFEEVARGLHDNPTRERIRQIEAKAVRKLQHPLRAYKLSNLVSLATDEEVKDRILRSPAYSEANEKRENVPIDELNLSIRTRAVLTRLRIHTLDQLAQVSTADLLSQKNFGESGIQDINNALASYGLPRI